MKPSFNPIIFKNDIRSDIKKAWEGINKMEMAAMSNRHDEDVDLAEELLRDALLDIKVKIAFALELLELNSMYGDFQNGFKTFEEKLTELYMVPAIGDLSSRPLEYLLRYKSALDLLADKEDDEARTVSEGRDRLERILIASPKILRDRGIEPKSEAQVRKAIYEVLIYVFPDTVREIPIPKVAKTYKPDIGVRSLKTAIEYKFADTEKEVKTCLDGIYEDMHGYAGSEDWTFFYAVIYMTDSFFTQEQIIAEFELSEATANWKPLLVTGRGAREITSDK